MILGKNKIYGHVNDPDTAIAKTSLSPNRYVFSSGGSAPTLETKGSPRGLLAIDNAGNPTFVSYAEPNKLIGINSLGQLTLFPKKVIPSSPPEGRQLVLEIYGSSTPSGTIGSNTLTLDYPFYYEVEVLGAGGGGGGGVIYASNENPHSSKNGTPGGAGGYVKMTFLVTAPTQALLQAGCAGGAGGGWTYSQNVLDGYSNYITGNSLGGLGGRSPIVLPGKGNAGGDATNGVSTRLGGLGIGVSAGNGGDANGVEIPGSGSAGGGANGRYGGNGGRFNGSYVKTPGLQDSGGAGGGAGGGVGEGGNGGSYGSTPGRIGYGGGGGGHGVIRSYSPTNINVRTSGGAGGGGGASRFVAGDLEIICGGGGGGAGGGSTDAGFNTAGGAGKNTKTGVLGGGGSGGSGGTAVSLDTLLSMYTTNGNSGARGVVRLWKCV